MATRAIYYDTETTGVRSEKDYIIELAAYDPERDATFERLINPGCPIPPGATAIHKITDEMVADAPTFADIAPEFNAFCEGNVALIAHNNDGFDKHFMRVEYGRAGVEQPPWIHLDSLKWARKYRNDLPRHSLQFLREVYDIEANNAHRALDDVMVLYKVVMAMIDDLSIDQMIDCLSRTKALTHMPYGKHKGEVLAEVPKSYVRWLAENGALDKPGSEDLKQAFEKLGVLV